MEMLQPIFYFVQNGIPSDMDMDINIDLELLAHKLFWLKEKLYPLTLSVATVKFLLDSVQVLLQST